MRFYLFTHYDREKLLFGCVELDDEQQRDKLLTCLREAFDNSSLANMWGLPIEAVQAAAVSEVEQRRLRRDWHTQEHFINLLNRKPQLGSGEGHVVLREAAGLLRQELKIQDITGIGPASVADLIDRLVEDVEAWIDPPSIYEFRGLQFVDGPDASTPESRAEEARLEDLRQTILAAGKKTTEDLVRFGESAAAVFRLTNSVEKADTEQARKDWATVKIALQEAAIRLRHRKDSPSSCPPVTINAPSVNMTTQAVSIQAQQLSVSTAEQDNGKTKGRKKREVAEPMIAKHLARRPHDTAQEVSDAVGCSKGVVVESPAWCANQERLKDAKRQGVEPIALPLVGYLARAGDNRQRQIRDHDQQQDAIDAEIDQREQELGHQIGEYKRKHPNATPQQVAKELGCTAGEVERRQAKLDQLTAEQADSALEDTDPRSDAGLKPKHVKKDV